MLAGPPGWTRPVQSAIDAAGARDRIVQTGFVDDRDRADLLAGASVFAYPSVYEGFGFPPLEAMQCGVPVVAGDAGALPEVLGDAAVLVPPTDVDALADAIRALADPTGRDPRHARRPRPRARAPLRLGHHRSPDGRPLPERDVSGATTLRGSIASAVRPAARAAGAGAEVMKVGLHVGQLLQPVPGGIGRYIVHVARNLPAADVEVGALRRRRAQRPRAEPDRHDGRPRMAARSDRATSCGTSCADPASTSTSTSCTRRAWRFPRCATSRSS